jgi:hypothetical protein
MLDYGKGAYSRTRGNLPPLETVNMFVEESQSQGVVMQSRPPLVEAFSVGSGPVRASLSKDGVFGGDRFTVSGSFAYRGTTLLGEVAGNGPVSIAMDSDEVLFCAGGPLYSYNGTNFVAVDFPDDSNVTQIIQTNGYFVALEAGTGYHFFSAIGNGRLWDALDFAEVESEPDALLWATVLDGIIVFAGPNSIEFWAPTGQADLPFTPIQQRIFEQGIIASGCMVQDDNTFFWIGADKILYRNGDVPQALGGDFLVERIEASTTYRVYLLKDQRHKFVCIRLDTETWAYDITTGEVFELRSYGRTNFRCGPDYGDDETGQIWAWGEYGQGEEIVERIVTAGERLLAPKIYDTVTVECEVGTTPYLTGTYAEPTLEFRVSDDGGNRWEDWETDTLGAQGDYRKPMEYRALGMFNLPGFLAQIRITDPVPFRVSGFYDNVNAKGRA